MCGTRLMSVLLPFATIRIHSRPGGFTWLRNYRRHKRRGAFQVYIQTGEKRKCISVFIMCSGLGKSIMEYIFTTTPVPNSVIIII